MSLSTTEELRLVTLGLEIGRAASVADACHLAVRQVGARLGVACAIRSLKGSDWHTIARSETPLEAPGADPATRIVLGHAKTPTEMLVAGALDADWIDALGGVVTAALQLVQLKVQRGEADRRSESIGHFSRALLAISDSSTLHGVIVEHMARAVGAEIGALAVLLPQENTLAVIATYGYPSVLVEHVRLAPGEGVLGRVFVTARRSLSRTCIGDAGHDRAAPLSHRLLRRALPLSGADGVVAVVALTDKTDGRAVQRRGSLAADADGGARGARAVARAAPRSHQRSGASRDRRRPDRPVQSPLLRDAAGTGVAAPAAASSTSSRC